MDRVRALRPGEAVRLPRHLHGLEVVLYRPLQPHGEAEDRQEGGKAMPAPEEAAEAAAAEEVAAVQGSTANVADGDAGEAAASPTDSAPDPHTHNTNNSKDEDDERGEDGVVARDGEAAAAPSLAPEPTATAAAPQPPLFFDTTAVLFHQSQNKADYVGAGRSATDGRSLVYKPHAVVLGQETATDGYCTYNVDTADAAFAAPSAAAHEDGAHREDSEQHKASESDEDEARAREAAALQPRTMMAAGDGVVLHLRRMSTCAGVLICATLFSDAATLRKEHRAYYMVRRSDTNEPVCLVPLIVPDTTEPHEDSEPQHEHACQSSIAIMLRKIKVAGTLCWELINVAEPLPVQDVKGVVFALQSRGLAEVANYRPDTTADEAGSRSARHTSSEDADEDESDDEESEDEEEGGRTSTGPDLTPDVNGAPSEDRTNGSAADVSPAAAAREADAGAAWVRAEAQFQNLLANVPPVAREGRRQYNVGRSHAHTNLAEGASSAEDEVADDALRAVVPFYAASNPVRYESGVYNVGSRPEATAAHYVTHRATYGLAAALAPQAPAYYVHAGAFGSTRFAFDRCQPDEDIHTRPDPPAELLPPKRRSNSHIRRSSLAGSASKKRSGSRRSRSGSSRRGKGKRKGSRKKKGNKKSKGKKKKSGSKGRKSRSRSGSRRRSTRSRSAKGK